jgi:hypothetical protein
MQQSNITCVHNAEPDIYQIESIAPYSDDMADMPQPSSDPIKEAVEQIRREAYAAGWKACHEAFSSALAAIGDGVEPGVIIQPFVGPARPSIETKASLPAVGTTPHFVYQAVQRKHGMTGAEVVAAVRAGGHEVAEPQIRTALMRLERRQLLVNRHKKWFLK